MVLMSAKPSREKILFDAGVRAGKLSTPAQARQGRRIVVAKPQGRHDPPKRTARKAGVKDAIVA
jgi:hypothetical protein